MSTISTFAPHSKNAALLHASQSPYQQRTTQKDNPTQQAIKQAVDFLIEQLEAALSKHGEERSRCLSCPPSSEQRRSCVRGISSACEDFRSSWSI